MTNTDVFVQNKSGVSYVTLSWSHKRKDAQLEHFNLFDALLIVGFLTALGGLVLLLVG